MSCDGDGHVPVFGFYCRVHRSPLDLRVPDCTLGAVPQGLGAVLGYPSWEYNLRGMILDPMTGKPSGRKLSGPLFLQAAHN